MSLQALGPFAFWVGLAAIGLGLFLLQRLRIRHRVVEVPTLLFWQEAMEEAPARVFVERFRHPLAYLLALAIAGGIWLALGAPGRTSPSQDKPYALLIDASATMATGDRLASAVDAAVTLADELPAYQRRVIWCGAEPRTVLLPGESGALLRRRLADAAAEACPSSLSRAARAFQAEAPDGTSIVLGDARLDGSLGNDPKVLRWPLEGADRGQNAGIAAFGIAPALSGDPALVDVLITTHGSETAPALQLEEEALASTSEVKIGDKTLHAFHDVPAAGGVVRASLPAADAIELDNHVSRALPKLRALRVALDPSLAGAFGAALAADRGLLVTTEDPDVVVRASRAFGGDLPALELVARDSQVEPILLEHDATQDSSAAMQELVPMLGLDRIDARALATALDTPLAVGARPAPNRSIRIWSDLLDPSGADLASSRTFPALVARGVRWLGNRPAFPAELAAGRPLSAAMDLRDPRGAQLATFGASGVPPVAGAWTGAAGEPQPVSLLADLTAEPATETPEAELDTASMNLVSLLILALLALLGLEWALVRTGRMP